MKLLIILIALAGIFFISFLDWQRSVKAVFFLVVIEGALRKWVIPQASDLIYFLKDFVLLGAYLQYYFFYKKKYNIQLSFINLVTFIAALWCAFHALNPSLGSPLVGILGLKSYVLYIPLMWMMPALFQSEEDLYKFLRSHLLLAIPVGLLGIIQFFSPVSSPINTYTPGSTAEVATFGTAGLNTVRITGTFPYVNSYTGYLIACFGLLIPFLSIGQSKWWRWASILEIFLVAVNMMMTGSRTPVFSAVLVFIGYLGITGLSQPSTLWRWLGRLLAPTAIASFAAFIGFRSAIDAFMERSSANNDLGDRILGNFTQPFDFFKYKELDGYGVGATHPGTSALRNALTLPPGEVIPTGYESEMGRVALEIGPIGFLFWYGLRISIAVLLWRIFCKLKRPFLRHLALTGFLVQIVWLSGFMVFHPTFSVYYWFFSGFIFLLPQLERLENLRQEQHLL